MFARADSYARSKQNDLLKFAVLVFTNYDLSSVCET